MNYSNLPHVLSALKHPHKLILENEDALLIHCTISNVYVAECTEGEENELAQYILKLSVIRLQTTNQKLYTLLLPYFKHHYECEQAVFNFFPQNFQDSKLEVLHPSDLNFTAESYEMPEYINQLYNRKRLFGYYDDEKLIGYVAFHIDETIGALFVKPEFRRKGYGEKIMSAAANIYHTENPESVCFAQILTENVTSIKLHEKMNCIFGPKVYWVYNEEYIYLS